MEGEADSDASRKHQVGAFSRVLPHLPLHAPPCKRMHRSLRTHLVMRIRMSRCEDRDLALQGANKAFAIFINDRTLSHPANEDLTERWRACSARHCIFPNIEMLSHRYQLPEVESEEMQLAGATDQLEVLDLFVHGAA